LLSGIRRRGLNQSLGRIGFSLLKDTHNLGFKFRKIESEHRTAWMEDQVVTLRKQRGVAAQGLSHATLYAIALMGLTHYFAGCKSHPRTRYARIELRVPWREEPAH